MDHIGAWSKVGAHQAAFADEDNLAPLARRLHGGQAGIGVSRTLDHFFAAHTAGQRPDLRHIVRACLEYRIEQLDAAAFAQL